MAKDLKDKKDFEKDLDKEIGLFDEELEEKKEDKKDLELDEELKELEKIELEENIEDEEEDKKIEEKDEEVEEEMEEEIIEEETEEKIEEDEDSKKEKVEEKIEEDKVSKKEKAEEKIDKKDIETAKKALKIILKELNKFAVKEEKMQPKVENVSKPKSAEMPKAIDEIEDEKEGNKYVKASMDKVGYENWSVSEREIDKIQSKPIDYNISIDSKELKSETQSIKVDKTTTPSNEIKKYYNKLDGGVGEEPSIAWDKKSSLNEYVKKIAELEKENKILQERLAIKEMADEVLRVVNILKDKNLIDESNEEEVAEFISNNFGTINSIRSLYKLVSILKGSNSELPESKVVPQVILPENEVSKKADMVSYLSEMWKKIK